jgi:hypothetical protein
MEGGREGGREEGREGGREGGRRGQGMFQNTDHCLEKTSI